MADEIREKKLAAARKKLQRYQQKRTPSNSPHPAKSRQPDTSTSNSFTTDPSPSTTDPNSSHLAEINLRSPAGVHHSTPSRVLETSGSTNANPSGSGRGKEYDTIERVPTLSNNYSSDASTKSSIEARPLSSTESLRQLSMQVNGLVSKTDYPNDNNLESVETRGLQALQIRNQELAADIDGHVQSNKELQLQVEEQRKTCLRLHEQLQKERAEWEHRLHKEQSSLREQLQVHIQTIGILVSEKTDLQTITAQAQQNLKQKSEESNNLLSRLQASRQRVAELERSLTGATSSSQQYQKTSKELDKDKDSLKLDVYKLKKVNDELTQQNSEVRSQLKSKIADFIDLEQFARNIREQLAASELRANQLANQNTDQQDTHNALLKVQEQNTDLETKIVQYNQSIQQLISEREQLAQQYQQHTNHYQKQVQDLTKQFQLEKEQNASLTIKETELQNQILAMESLQQVAESKQDDGASQEEIERLQLRITQLEDERKSTHAQYEQQVGDNAQLSRLYQEKEDLIDDLQDQISRLHDESTDRAALLDNIQADKATISRALSQNKELKLQLEELQSAFVKMTNDNMEMLSSLKSEQHIGHELATRLGEQEQELRDIKEQFDSKNNECDLVKEQNHALNKQLLQEATMTDRVQHYEAQSYMHETLQKDLVKAQMIQRELSDENSHLRVRIANLEVYHSESQTSQEGNSGEDGASVSRDDVVDSLSAAIRQLEEERNQLTESFQQQQTEHQVLTEEIEHLRNEHDQGPAVLTDVQFVSKEAFETMEVAMDMLQAKFAVVMREKAELSERCQQLDHVNLQLSGETETIGEYISLYHSQRDMMKRRQDERERFVTSLAQEKEEMQQKLNQLQNLMMQLIQEKKHSSNELPTFLGLPSVPGGANPLSNSPRSPFGGGLANSHYSPKRQQTLTGDMDHTHDESDEWPSSSSEDSCEEVTLDEHYQTANQGLDNVSLVPNHTTNHTAQQIIELLEDIGGTHIIDRGTILDRDFAPCKCCSGTLVDV